MAALVRCTIACTWSLESVDAVLRLDEHRRRRVLLLRHEHRVLRDGEADGCRLDALHRADRRAQLALHRALVGDGLLELRRGHAHLVEQRVAAGVRRRQAGRRGLEPLVVDLLLRHQDRAAAVGELVRNTVGLQLVDDARGVRRGQPGEQRACTAAAPPTASGPVTPSTSTATPMIAMVRCANENPRIVSPIRRKKLVTCEASGLHPHDLVERVDGLVTHGGHQLQRRPARATRRSWRCGCR